MNMEFVWWVTGILATVAALRFVWMVFRKLTSKEALTAILEKAGEGMENCAEKLKDKALEKRLKKEEQKAKQEMTYTIR